MTNTKGYLNMSRITLSAIALLFSLGAHAEATLFSLPTDNRMGEFVYDKNNVYTVLCQELKPTDIEVGEDEVIEGKAIGDSVLFKVEEAGSHHIFVRPQKADIETSMTILTDKRAYQITLRSGPDGGKWNQHVAWSYPDIEANKIFKARKVEKAKAVEQQGLEQAVISKDVNVDGLNSNYTITGEESIKPLYVLDNGERTWIKLKKTPELAALYIEQADGKFAMVDYFGPKNGYLIVQRTANKFVLKLDDKEVHISRTK